MIVLNIKNKVLLLYFICSYAINWIKMLHENNSVYVQYFIYFWVSFNDAG
jgi:hypothetical protein